MADRKLINPAIVKDIADAIREKGGTTEQIKVADLGDAVRALPEGGGVGEDTSALLDAIGVESREDTGMANGLAIALTDSASEQMWSGARSVADGAPIKDGVAFVSTLKGKTMKVNQLVDMRKFTSYPGTREWGENTISMTSTPTLTYLTFYSDSAIIPKAGHKYFNIAYLTLGGAIRAYFINANISSSSQASTSDGICTGFVTAPETISSNRFSVTFVKNADQVITPRITEWMCFDLTDMFGSGNEPTTAEAFAEAFGRKSIADLPYIPYQETNLQSFAPNAVVSKKDGVELGRLPFDLTTIVDADGNQLFPEGELRSAGSVADMVDYANNVAEASFEPIDLGKLTWKTFMADKHLYQARITNTNHYNGAMLSARYSKGSYAFADLANLQIRSSQSDTTNLVLRDDAYDTPEALKASLNGQILLYEYKEHLTAQFTPTKAWYPVQNNGAEEAITDTIVPFNGEIRYRVDTESLLTQSASLLRYSNEVTGANDKSIGDAVLTLTDSYK